MTYPTAISTLESDTTRVGAIVRDEPRRWYRDPSAFQLELARRLLARARRGGDAVARRRVLAGACVALVSRLCRDAAADIAVVRTELHAFELELARVGSTTPWGRSLLSLLEERRAQLARLASLSSEATLIMLQLPIGPALGDSFQPSQRHACPPRRLPDGSLLPPPCVDSKPRAAA